MQNLNMQDLNRLNLKKSKNRSENRQYPELPILSAGAIIFSGESVLLIQRGHEPAKGLWSIPGGVIKVGESISEGLIREIFEETGVRILLKDLVEIIERIFRDEQGRVTYHYVILDYLAEYEEGLVRHDSDAVDAKFVLLDELSSYRMTEGLEIIIKKAWKMKESQSPRVYELRSQKPIISLQ